MQRMVGFRNVALHEHTRLNPDIVQTIISKHLDDFRRFSSTIMKACGQTGPHTHNHFRPHPSRAQVIVEN
ncbi:MAG: DUF86 domain-containing protein [Nitrospira sp.]|nr:DUF86 domain-containing protein [Nitrospira sp.]